MRKKLGLLVLGFLLFFTNICFVYAEDEDTLSSTSETTTTNDPLLLNASAAIVMDVKTGNILYEKNIHETYYPASITKILTLYLALNNLDADDMLTASNEDIDTVSRTSSHIAIDYDEELSAQDLEYAMMLASANDAANVLATGVSGDLTSFATLMNETCAALGCEDSNFTNANGLEDENHYTSAYDMALIMRALVQNDTAVEIMSTISYTMDTTNKQDENRVVANGFEMIKNTDFYDERVICGKNGYTPSAGYTSVAYAQYGNLEVVMVVLDEAEGDYRYTDLSTMMDYVFGEYKTVVVSASDVGTYTASISGEDVTFGLSTDFSILLPYSADESLLTYEFQTTNLDSVESATALVNVYLDGDLLGSLSASLMNDSGSVESSNDSSVSTSSDATVEEEVDFQTALINNLIGLSLIDKLSLGVLIFVIGLKVFVYLRKLLTIS